MTTKLLSLRALMLGVTTLGLAACTADAESDAAPTQAAADDDADVDDGSDATGTATSALLSRGDARRMNLWDDSFYRDTHVARKSYDSNFKNDGFNDKASSFVNNTGSYWIFFQNTGYDGPHVCVRPHSHLADLNGCPNPFFCYEWGDRISSMKKVTLAEANGRYDCDVYAIGDAN